MRSATPWLIFVMRRDTGAIRRNRRRIVTKANAQAKITARLLFLGLALVLGHGMARAQSLDIPSKHWGLSFGNSAEFTGLRFNFRDSKVKRITGVSITLWQPRKDNEDSRVTGLSLGLLPGAAHMRGIQVGLLGIVGLKSITGISVGALGLGAGDDVIGINLAGLGLGAGKNLKGINIAGLGLGAGENLFGINVAGLGLGAGKNLIGINIGGLGIGGSDDATGINIGGIGAGAGKRMIGLNIGGLGLGAGDMLGGINISGLGMGAGGRLVGLSVAGLAAGSKEVNGLTIAGGVVGGRTLKGIQVAGGMVYVVKEGSLSGCAVSPFNYIRGAQTGVSIGVVNYAWSVKGIQLGLVNIVRDNPPGLKILPVFNTSF